jgi:CRISPR-associated protein (TIGR02710 family)
MMRTNNSRRVLVLTVGTGDIDAIEPTLLVPMLKSVEDGEWDRIVLLPSRTTEEFAQTLQERIANPAVKIDALPASGQENNADACFGHFDAVLARLIGDGFKPSDIVVDFTRGTKAMSAALVLAALGRDIPVLRYVHNEREGRDKRGMVIPGTEKIGQIKTNLATERRRLDQAERLMGHGDFGAVIELLPDLDGPFAELFPERFRVQAEALRSASHIYAAWDRLDYKAAVAALDRHEPAAKEAGRFAPTPAMITWLRLLDQRPDPNRFEAMAVHLRAVVCDLLANAERRLRDRHFEDALIRAYRVLELIGQIRLFDRGYDSAALPPDDATIVRLREKLKKSKSNDFDKDTKTGKLKASRYLVARLLKELNDKLADQLLNFDKSHSEAQTRSRNKSILTHGFTSTAPAEAGLLREVLADLERLLQEDDPQASERLTVARSLDFSQGDPVV